MKKYYLKSLLIGAVMIFSMSAFIACSNSDIDDLKTRVTVLEGMIRELEEDLQNAMVTGATITNAVQDAKGIWTLTLSDGKVITINPTSGGGEGGSTVTVEETADAFIIKVDGNEYVIPKGGSSSVISSLVFSPEFTDGAVLLNNDGAEVRLLPTPALSEEQINGATYEIADAHVLQTRAGDDLFSIAEKAKDGDYIKLKIKGLAVEASASYTVAVRVTIDGSSISSNYFRVNVSDDFSFTSEEIIDPDFADGVSGYEKLEGGFSKANLPEEFDFIGGCNFRDLFKTLPDGKITFSLAPKALQNNKAQDIYDDLKGFLASDGAWKMTKRMGTNLTDDVDDATKTGILIYLKADDVTKAKIYWQIYDPIKDVDFKLGLSGAPHLEYWPVLPAGVNDISFGTLFMAGPDENELLWYQHDGGKLTTAWPNAEVTLKDAGDIIYNDGGPLKMGEAGEKWASLSKGLFWQNIQTSIVSSQRNNWTGEKPTTSENNGEIIGGYDGISGEDMVNFGLSISEDGHLKTSENYQGWGFRFGMGLRYEYVYGTKTVGGDNVLAFVFFNRRVAPEGVTDPNPR